jgi:hypothetical protein
VGPALHLEVIDEVAFGQEATDRSGVMTRAMIQVYLQVLSASTTC